MLGPIDKESHILIFSIFAMKPSFVGHFSVHPLPEGLGGVYRFNFGHILC